MSDAKTNPGARGTGYIASSEAGAEFRSASGLLRWLFAQRRLQGQSVGDGGGRTTAHALDARLARWTYAAKCLSDLSADQARLLALVFGEGMREATLADRMDCSERTVGRRIRRAVLMVRRRARELGLLEE